MAVNNTKIAWTDATWSPVRGCSRVSPGCQNCYAERMAARFSGSGQPYEGLVHDGRWNGEVRFVPEMLGAPLRWRKPRRVFVNSMSDLFHPKVTDEQIAAVFGVMAACPQHTFQVLTKRQKRMVEWFGWVKKYGGGLFGPFGICAGEYGIGVNEEMRQAIAGIRWPLPNVWLGVTAENQAAADSRIPLLLEAPAAVRWVSIEPMLGPIDLTSINSPSGDTIDALHEEFDDSLGANGPRLDWIVCGGESGPRARPMHPDWPRAVVRQCKAAGVACFMKQRGAWAARSWGACTTAGSKWGALSASGDWYPGTTPWNGRTGDDSPEREEVMVYVGGAGSDPAEWPEDLRVREYPR